MTTVSENVKRTNNKLPQSLNILVVLFFVYFIYSFNCGLFIEVSILEHVA